ncbi:hypothetical protein XENOCAPTIV_023329, partial [Xenoophorus captivus]
LDLLLSITETGFQQSSVLLPEASLYPARDAARTKQGKAKLCSMKAAEKNATQGGCSASTCEFYDNARGLCVTRVLWSSYKTTAQHNTAYTNLRSMYIYLWSIDCLGVCVRLSVQLLEQDPAAMQT